MRTKIFIVMRVYTKLTTLMEDGYREKASAADAEGDVDLLCWGAGGSPPSVTVLLLKQVFPSR